MYRDDDTDLDLLYFDGYRNNEPPACNRLGFRLIDRKATLRLDNKSLMARTLMAAGQQRPRVYFDVECVPTIPESLWYVKNPLATAGRDMYCVPRVQIADVFQKGFIIQEAITDLDLIDERKYTIRAYVLVAHDRVYLYPQATLVVHGVPYQADDLSAEVQFLHEGYMRSDSEVRMELFSDHSQYRTILGNLQTMVANSFAPYADILCDGEAQSYCLFGIDALVERSLDTVLIEINDRPNFVHTPMINISVNIPMLQAMMAVLAPETFADDIHPGSRFVEVLQLASSSEEPAQGQQLQDCPL